MPGDSTEDKTQLNPETGLEPPAAERSDAATLPRSTTLQVPDHELLRRIGGGAYGEVWLARNVMGTYRAVKIVYRKTFSNDRPYEREFTGIQKFEPISRSHERLVDVLQVGRNDPAGYFYYVMELADDANVGQASSLPVERASRPAVTHGHKASRTATRETETGSSIANRQSEIANPEKYIPKTLAKELHNRGRLPADECLRLRLTLTSALGHLHRHGLIHRDIKPSNIIFVNGIPKLADIGLVADAAEARSFVGTEGFIPPEGPGTARADLYSLGKVVYEICTGKDRQEFPELPTLLGDGQDRTELLELNEVVLKACEDEPTQRYQSAEEMHADLVFLQRGKSVKRLRSVEQRLAVLTRVGTAVAMAAVVVTGAYFYQQLQTRRFEKLAHENLQLAGEEARQRQKFQEAFSKSDSLLAGQLIERDKPDHAVAFLCRALRSDPTNVVAGAKLLSTLLYSNFATPCSRPFRQDGEEPSSSVVVNTEATRAVVLYRSGPPKFLDLGTGKSLTPRIHEPGLEMLRKLVSRATNSDPFRFLIPKHVLMGLQAIYDRPIIAAAFSRDGNKVAMASRDGTARVWDWATGQPAAPPLIH